MIFQIGRTNVLQEYLSSHDHLEVDGEQRLVIHE